MQHRLARLAFLLLAPAAFAHPGGQRTEEVSPGARGIHAPSKTPAGEAAHGRAGDARKAARTVALEMTSSGACSPATIAVKKGETVRLVARNRSDSAQDLALGTTGDLRFHAEMARRFPQAQAARSGRITVKPGESGTLVWHFTRAGTFDLACGPAARFDAARAGKVVVTAR
jgi:uncharacterized cupredoxin-like copper-binding protein